ncbi:MAG: restriction endonuclease subunit S [Candidatus Binataceae bacterium]
MAKPQPHALESGAQGAGELPEGWALATLGQVCELNPAKAPTDALAANAPVTFVPMAAVDADSGTIAAPEIRPFASVRKGYTSFRAGDVIMAKITPCAENGKAAVASNLQNGLGFGSTEFHVLRPSSVVLAEYVYHFIRRESFREAAATEMTGSVGQKRVPAWFLENADLPLPPFSEQGRIVAKIEPLLARVTTTRDKLAKVPTILRRFRQSVLAAACSGSLTADWREGHRDVQPVTAARHRRGRLGEIGDYSAPYDLPDSWEWFPAGDFYEDARYGTSTKCSSEEVDGVPVLRVPNIAAGVLDLRYLKYARLSDKELTRLCLEAGDIVVCRTNGSLDLIGKAAVVRTLPKPHAFASYLIRLRLLPGLMPEYAHHCISGPVGRYQIEAKARTSAGQFNLNLEILGSLRMPIPPLEEQCEIVWRAAALFKLADAIEKRVAVATARAERLTQSILAKAFRGELVPTEAELARREDREYESAFALLARIVHNSQHEELSNSRPSGL